MQTGWLEERLPFFYIWLPKQFQLEHPEIVQSLKINKNRLTSPYDVYVTLKHILKMSGGQVEPISISCPTCKSLFTELPIERSCPDAAIDKHWCTCDELHEMDATNSIVQKAVKHIISTMNNDLSIQPRCAKLKLNKISSARKSTHGTTNNYLINFNVEPSNAQLEATVRYEMEKYEMIGSISRLNRYGNQSWCISDANLRKICYCL